MLPKEIIAKFDRFLAKRELSLEAVVIGGAALGLLGVVSRHTRDCDILHPKLPDDIVLAAKEFAAVIRKEGEPLRDDWLNNGPHSVGDLLPVGWQDRLRPLYKGRAIALLTLDRSDLLLTKLFGFCDRATDLGDCLALAPTRKELKAAMPWLQKQDAHPGWPDHVEESLRDLARRLGYEL